MRQWDLALNAIYLTDSLLLSPANSITRKQDKQIKAALFQFIADRGSFDSAIHCSICQLSSVCSALIVLRWSIIINELPLRLIEEISPVCLHLSFTWQLHDAFRPYQRTTRRRQYFSANSWDLLALTCYSAVSLGDHTTHSARHTHHRIGSMILQGGDHECGDRVYNVSCWVAPQGQIPLVGALSLKLKAFCPCSYKRGAKG